MNNSDLKALLERSREDLLLELGNSLPMFGVSRRSDVAKRDAAIRWLDAKRQEFCRLICGSDTIRRIACEESAARNIQLLAALADLLATHLSALPVATVSALLVQSGIDRLCEDEWRV